MDGQFNSRNYFLISAVIIPLLVAIIGGPYLYNYFFPKYSLTFEVSKLLNVKRVSAFNLIISNQGENSEKNVDVFIDKFPYLEGKGVLGIESSRDVKIKNNEKNYIISIGDLRAGEVFTASFILSDTGLISYSDKIVQNIQVNSAERVAEQVVSLPSFIDFFPYFLWLLGILFFLFILIGIFETNKAPEKHIDWHQEQIKKYIQKINERDRAKIESSKDDSSTKK